MAMYRRLNAGIAMLLICGFVTGCNSLNAKGSQVSKRSHHTIKVHINKAGVPIAPYVYKNVEVDIVPLISWNHVTNSFGYIGNMIEGAKNSQWISLSLIKQALTGAGFSTSLSPQTLNLIVPNVIRVDHAVSTNKNTVGTDQLAVTINGHKVAIVPLVKPVKSSGSFVPVAPLIKALSSVHMKMRWQHQVGQNIDHLELGSPIYGSVTTVTTFASSNLTRTMSGMTIINAGDNWIPYDYIAGSLDNIQGGIIVSTLGTFAGINISVPASISVNMSHLPVNHTYPKNEVPIEINHRVVGYAFSMVPKFGPSTGYLSSAEVMKAIKRIGIAMHLNHTDGTFTQWNITAKALK